MATKRQINRYFRLRFAGIRYAKTENKQLLLFLVFRVDDIFQFKSIEKCPFDRTEPDLVEATLFILLIETSNRSD